MKKLALTLLLSGLATAAFAEGDEPFPLQCGVNIGGKSLTGVDNASGKKSWDKRMNHVVGAVQAEPAPFTPAPPSAADNVEIRLPAEFTFATIGCSWR